MSLIVVLHGEGTIDPFGWFKLNQAWMTMSDIRLYVLGSSASETSSASLIPIDLSSNKFSLADACADMQSISSGESDSTKGIVESDVLIADHRFFGHMDWRIKLDRCREVVDLRSATGRLLHSSAKSSGTRALGDRTPELISNNVLGWSLSGKIHGVRCSSLPPNFLWIDQRSSLDIITKILHLSKVGEAVDRFYRDVPVIERGCDAYLPDVVAYER